TVTEAANLSFWPFSAAGMRNPVPADEKLVDRALPLQGADFLFSTLGADRDRDKADFALRSTNPGDDQGDHRLGWDALVEQESQLWSLASGVSDGNGPGQRSINIHRNLPHSRR